MSGVTYRIITLWFCLLFGALWAWISVQQQVMYVPPGEVQAFMTALLAGKWIQSTKGVRDATQP